VFVDLVRANADPTPSAERGFLVNRLSIRYMHRMRHIVLIWTGEVSYPVLGYYIMRWMEYYFAPLDITLFTPLKQPTLLYLQYSFIVFGKKAVTHG
jgi:hypothetical protein